MLKLFKNKFIFILIFNTINIFSQINSDKDLILHKDSNCFENYQVREVSYLFKDKKFIVKYNPISVFFGGLLLIYQKYISIQIAANCPYEISCSNFAKQCIQRYGLLYGIPLSADRLTRCTRLASFDLIRGVEYNSRTNKIYDNPSFYQIKK